MPFSGLTYGAAAQWSHTPIQVKIDVAPFARGSLRLVYHMLESKGPGTRGKPTPAKPKLPPGKGLSLQHLDPNRTEPHQVGHPGFTPIKPSRSDPVASPLPAAGSSGKTTPFSAPLQQR